MLVDSTLIDVRVGFTAEVYTEAVALWRGLVERCFGAWYKSLREKKGGDARAFEPDTNEEPTDPRMRGDV